MRLWLYVPYEERMDARSLGAKFCKEKKQWYVDDPDNKTQYRRWLGNGAMRKLYRNPPKKRVTELPAYASLAEIRIKQREDYREYVLEQKMLKEKNNKILIKPLERVPSIKTARRVKKDGTVVEFCEKVAKQKL